MSESHILNLGLQPKQTEAFMSQATEIMYGGSAGSGKSHLMRVAAITWALEIPKLQIYLFRRVSDDLIKNHLEGSNGFLNMLAGLVEMKYVKISNVTGKIVFKNGSMINLCHCQYEKDMYKYQGAEIHVLLIDELTHFTEKIYRFLRNRVRMTGLKLPKKYDGMFPRIMSGTNPGGIGHNFVKAMFVDAAPPMEIVEVGDEEGGMKRQFIPALLSDNQELLREDPSYRARLRGLGSSDMVRAMEKGEWDIVIGGAFDDVWERATHVMRPFRIPPSWRIDRSFDWGSSHPFSVGWWAESDGTEAKMYDGKIRSFPRGTLFRISEWYGWNGRPNQGVKMSAEEQARGILEREERMGYDVLPGPADSSIFDVLDKESDSIAQKHQKAGVKWLKADKRSGTRVNGLDLMRGRLAASKESPMENKGMFIFDTCVNFIRTIPVLPRAENKPEDIDTHAEDHIYDEARYRVLRAARSSIIDIYTRKPVKKVG